MRQAFAGFGLTAGISRIAVLGGARALAALLAALSSLVVAPGLGPEALGVWAMLLAVQGWALHASELGLRSVVTAEAACTKGGALALLAPYLRLRLPLALTVGATMAAGAALLAPTTVPATVLVATSLVAIALHFDWMALVAGRAMTAALLLLVRPGCFLLLLVVLPGGLDTERVALAFAIAWWLAAVASWTQIERGGTTVQGNAAPVPIRAMLRQGLPLLVVTLTNQALLSFDLLLVGVILGPAAAGQFYLATAVAVAGTVFANAANQLAMARLGPLRDDPPRFRAAVERKLGQALLLGAVIAAAAGMAGPLLLPRLMGTTYQQAGWLVLVLAPWLMLQHGTALLQGALVAGGQVPALLRGNLIMLAALGMGLACALSLASLGLIALARGLAEACRLAALWYDLRGMDVAVRQ